MKKIYLFAALATMLAACSENDLTKDTAVQQNAEEGAVQFGAYVNRSTTRAGWAGTLTTSTGTNNLQTEGFGVFGFYTNNSDYDPQSIPNFFYNQKVEFKGGLWTYEPVKYWPNEYGEDAVSDDYDRVSYFAYAPYVDVVPSTGKLVKSSTPNDEDKWGITGMSRNSAMGDPLIKYIASFDQNKAVDLIWGVCDNPEWSIIQGGTKQDINDGKEGLPWLNVQRPQETNNQRLKFTFKHALSQLSVNVDAFVDGYDNGKSLDAAETRIFIRSISFIGFAMKGALDLNNTEKDKAYWLDYNGTADLETGEVVTIYDGRKDGKEGATGSVATNEKLLGLNPQFVQDVEWYDNGVVNTNMAAGVTNIPAPLFRNFNGTEYVAATQPALVIPTGEQVEVEIVYDIETVDENLATYVSDGNNQGSSIENRIKKTINFGPNGLENGKHYTINLHLGLNSVKFDASVSDWQEAAVTPDVDLPSNMPSFIASDKDPKSDIKVDWDYATAVGKEYIYAVTGFDGGEAVTVTSTTTTDFTAVTVNSKPTFNGTENQANASGIAYVKVQIKNDNNDVLNKDLTQDVVVTGGVSGRTHTLDVTQLARPLSMRVKEVAAAGTSITLQRWNGTAAIELTDAANWQKNSTGVTSPDNFSFTILKNGVKMVEGTGAGKYQLGSKTTTELPITLGTAVAAGDIYTITVKTGDAAEETVVAKIGGIAFIAPSREITYKVAKQASDLPTLYGPGTNAATIYDWTPESGNGAIGADGMITTTQSSSSPITVTATLKDTYITNAGKEGWFYTNVSKTDSYQLNIKKQSATLSFVGAPTTLKQSQVNNYTLAATQTAAIDGTPDGTVNYTITYTPSGSSSVTTSSVDSNGKISITGAPGIGDKFTVKAEITADTDKYTFGVPVEVSYTVEVISD